MILAKRNLQETLQISCFTLYFSCKLLASILSMVPTKALQNSLHHYLLIALKPYLLIINSIVLVFITILELIAFGLSITLLKYWTGYIKLIRPQELDDLIVTILLHYI